MLKEGWDVTNLYTIIPLRAANSQILTEQTIGRGLRLPYGARTGEEKVDKLTIIAHNRFQSIVDAANNPNSIIRKENIVEIDPNELPADQEVITSASVMQSSFDQRREQISQMHVETQKQNAETLLNTQQMIVDAVNSLGSQIKNIDDLKVVKYKNLLLKKWLSVLKARNNQTYLKMK